MKEDIKDLWVEVLRSGKYKQIHGSLVKDGGFCCLGVLSEISGVDYNRHEAYLGHDVIKWSGMGTNDGMFKTDEMCSPSTVAKLNDGANGMGIVAKFEAYSFDQIADVIEEKWEEL